MLCTAEFVTHARVQISCEPAYNGDSAHWNLRCRVDLLGDYLHQ